jgi:nitroreductase
MQKRYEFDNPTLNTIFNRRSVRVFKDEPIPKDLKDLIIMGAMRAPTAGNMMFYSILEVNDQTKKEKLAITCDNQPFISKTPLVLIFLADYQKWYEYDQYCDVQEMCARKDIVYDLPKESNLMMCTVDAVIAAQNAVITAQALGLTSVYIGDIMEHYETHKEIFNLPKYALPVAMICIGYAKHPEKLNELTYRFSKTLVCHKDTYDHWTKSKLEEFDKELNKMRKIPDRFIEDFKNQGQYLYWMKSGAKFTKEMIRSVKVMLKNWI